jgi:hypothetical protein
MLIKKLQAKWLHGYDTSEKAKLQIQKSNERFLGIEVRKG